jgi:hypothetical protein
MNKYDELEKWQKVQYRMREEGIEYCFRHYSSFEEIEDKKFHEFRRILLDYMNAMETLVQIRIEDLETQISAEDE